jgi:arsenate reductase
MNKTRVLFLSREDHAPGAMAQAFLSQCAGDRFEAHVAGVHPASVDPMALHVMEEAWINQGDPCSMDARQFGDDDYDVIVTIHSRAVGIPEQTGSLDWLLESPASSGVLTADRLEAWRRIRATICRKVIELIRLCSQLQLQGSRLPDQGIPGCPA